MNLFRHRPLFLLCTVFIAAMAFGYLIQGWLKILLIGLSCVALLAVLTVMLLRQKARCRCLLPAVALLVAVGAFFESYICLNLHRDAADTFVGRTGQVEAIVTEVGGSSGRLSTYTVQISSIDGDDVDYAARLTCYYPVDLHIGDRVALTADVISAAQAAGDKYAEYALLADGISLGLEVYQEEDCTVLSTGEGGFFLTLARLRKNLAAHLTLRCGETAAGLPAALLLGERADIPQAVTRDFSRAGVAHVLAISGMHMSLIFGLLAGLFRLFRLSPKLRAVLLGTLAFGYLAFLGFPPSASRSVIMLGGTYLAHLCSARADALTSLGVAGALILLCSPTAVADVGFWMSFSSAFGLITLMTLWREMDTSSAASDPRHSLMRRFLLFAKGFGRRGLIVLSAGVIAMTTSLWITVGVLGEISILSPVSTVLLTPLVMFVLVATVLLMFLSATPIAPWMVEGINFACSLMVRVVEWLSDIPWSVIPLRSNGVWAVVVVSTVCLLLFMILRLPRRELVLLPILLGWVIIGIIEGMTMEMGKYDLTVDYLLPSSNSEMLVVTQGREAVICDLSDGSYSAISDAANQARDAGATVIEAVVITHYHTRTVGALERLMTQEKVQALWLPIPADEDDYYTFLACTETAAVYDISVSVYSLGDPLQIFGQASLQIDRTTLHRSDHPVLMVSLDADGLQQDDGDRLLFCGGAVFESSLASAAQEAVMTADALILGTHGPTTKATLADLSGSCATRMSLADGELVDWLPREYVPTNVDAIHIGDTRFTLSGKEKS